MTHETKIGTNVQSELSNVQKFYEGASIFITGGSGLLGNLLIQKLLRDCPDLSKIYVLLREKKGKTPHQRIEEMFQESVFEKMKIEKPNYKEKIKLITGDLEQPGLALNEDDKNLISNEVNIIFHLAATVKFNEKIKKAVAINFRATKDMLTLARTITNLKAFVHCSTAYSFYPQKCISEEFYNTHILPERLLQITETLNDDELEILSPKLIGDWPNTYAFTKGVTEKLIQKEAGNLPVIVFRPSIVIPTFNNPVEGWINNVYGPLGITLGIHLGLIHVARANPNVKADIIPGDYVINNMIVAAQYVGAILNSRKQDEKVIFDEIKTADGIPIFNCVSSSENPINWNEYISYTFKCFEQCNTIHAFWYPFVYLVPNFFLYTILQFFLHKIPAYIVDFILYAIGKKPKLIKIYEKIDAAMDPLVSFSTKEWNFRNENNQALWNSLNNRDKELFEFSVKQFDWKNYFGKEFGKGLRIYLFKDPLETLPRALERHKKLKFAHFTLKNLCYLISAYVGFQLVYRLQSYTFKIVYNILFGGVSQHNLFM